MELEFRFELKGRGAWERLKEMIKDIEKEYPNAKVRVEIPL